MHCSSCGSEVPLAVVAAPFCAFCGARRGEGPSAGRVAAAVVSAGAGVFAWPAQATVARRDVDETWRAEVFTRSASNLCLAFDPQVGFLLIGAYVPDDGKPCLRAYDVQRRSVLWEALSGTRGLDDVSHDELAIRGRSVYVSLDRSLHVLDLLTGKPLWNAEFTDKLASGPSEGPLRGLYILDACPVGQRGAIVTATADYTIVSLDRDSGKQLWREVKENPPGDATAIPEVGVIFFQRTHTIMSPFSQKPVAGISGRIERCDIVGPYGILQVRDWGWREREGVVLHDFMANKEVLFEAVDGLEDDVPSVMGDGRVFAAVEGGAKLTAVPGSKPVELVPGFHVRSMVVCGPTLFVLLRKTHGTSYRRIVGVDPMTLGVRFDLGEQPTQPSDNWTGQMCTNGQVVVMVASPTNNDDACELWGVDAGGRTLWRAPVGDWQEHYMLGGHVVVRVENGWKVVRPEDGQVVATYGRGGD